MITPLNTFPMPSVVTVVQLDAFGAEDEGGTEVDGGIEDDGGTVVIRGVEVVDV